MSPGTKIIIFVLLLFFCAQDIYFLPIHYELIGKKIIVFLAYSLN